MDMTNGHRQRPWGLYAAVVITILAGVVILSQIWRGTAPGRQDLPEPTETILPAPLWTPPATIDCLDRTKGGKVHPEIPCVARSPESLRTGSSPVIYLRVWMPSP